jgi:phosphoglycolate phosphatase-like HAD superfamily hydrolase
MDIRTAFARCGPDGVRRRLRPLADQGVQRPDARISISALEALGVSPDEALMVGDRAGPDGGAVATGIVPLLLPP